jgi:hypothetical protein
MMKENRKPKELAYLEKLKAKLTETQQEITTVLKADTGNSFKKTQPMPEPNITGKGGLYAIDSANQVMQAIEAGPEAQAKAVKTNIADGLAALEQANARLRQSSGIANLEAFKTETANNALMDYLSGKGSAQTAADALRSIANEAIASGKLTAQEATALKGALGQAKAYVDAMGLVGDNGIGVSGRNTIYGIPIIDGKVGGKIPLDEYKVIRESSVINPDADSMTLGQYGDGGANSYIARAGKDSTYFDMGNKWNAVKQKYNLSNKEMFDYFNKPALDDAINSGKTIRFSHNPLDYSGSFLADEWAYIKHILNLKDADLIFKGGFWYVG